MNAWRLFAGATVATGVLMGTAGCTEKPQTITSAKIRASDTKASDGTTQAAHAAPGWKAGDAKSWEEQLHARTLNGQNEYSRNTGR